MKLHPKAMQALFDVLEPGFDVICKVTPEGKFTVRAVPEEKDVIKLPVPLLVSDSMDAPVKIHLTAKIPGDESVALVTVEVPAGFFIDSLKGGYRPEVTEEVTAPREEVEPVTSRPEDLFIDD